MKFSFLPEKNNLPKIANVERSATGLEAWSEAVKALADQDTATAASELTSNPSGAALLTAIFGNSPFLEQCATREIPSFIAFLAEGPEQALGKEIHRLSKDVSSLTDRTAVMRGLRHARRRGALVIALADITQIWSVDEVIQALSRLADALISSAVCHLLRQAHARGELVLPHPDQPERDCGYLILGMGKLGARELNYSSDVDLIVLFDPDKVDYRHQRAPQEGYVRLTRELMRILDERTTDGYVCRTDLRLRPDPAAMPLAISINSALTYYESMGQNWERAAMIKARPIAGDMRLGDQFLQELRPFIWRKHLDFWAIQDVHSIKRQIHAQKGGSKIAVQGHNIKLGRGGIREIEFFVQTQQLIWGGRNPALRCQRTVDGLSALAVAGQIAETTADELTAAYGYLRRLENRLQMVDDRQTHDLPDSPEGVREIAAFLGHDDVTAFESELLAQLRVVEDHYARLFEEAPDLSGPGNLVFTGGEIDPGTDTTLREMGFSDGSRVFHLVRGWHHGRYRATRSTRSRQLLTEIMPALLLALSQTAHPDQALLRFDAFLAKLPAGVQLFSLLVSNPRLLDLLSEIMGGAPQLAESLSARPVLLEAVLSSDFFESAPDASRLADELTETLVQARDFQDVLDLTRRWSSDLKFQSGLRLLRHTADIDESGMALSDVADTVIRGLYPQVQTEFARRHGAPPGGGLAVLALGTLGGREVTVSSDLDLVFLYEEPRDAKPSDGAKPLQPALYFARLAQRFINALTAQTAEGGLYEIDMRLRPSGKSGPIATSLKGFLAYHSKEAWTWEHMALTRARVVSGGADFAARIEGGIQKILCQPRDPQKLVRDISEMRQRIEKEHPAKSLWSVKYLRGGLVDLEFLAQYLQLRHAATHSEILDSSTQRVFEKLAERELLNAETARRLVAATRLVRQVQGLLRLTVGPAYDADSLPDGLQISFANAAGAGSFAALRQDLTETAAYVNTTFAELIDRPAEDLGAGAETPE